MGDGDDFICIMTRDFPKYRGIFRSQSQSQKTVGILKIALFIDWKIHELAVLESFIFFKKN
jgi:hypothetical protein